MRFNKYFLGSVSVFLLAGCVFLPTPYEEETKKYSDINPDKIISDVYSGNTQGLEDLFNQKLPTQELEQPEEEVVWKKFDGAWFAVKYPESFTVVPGLLTAEAADNAGGEVDSVNFIGPDEDISFYVYSPLMGDANLGLPDEILLDPLIEELVSESDKSDENFGFKYTTIKAKDGSYWRSYVDKVDLNGADKVVFGVEYSSSDIYDNYRSDYLIFKDSLEQFWWD